MTSFFDHNQVKINKEYMRESAKQIDYSLSDFLHDDIPHNLIEQNVLDHAYIKHVSSLLKTDSIYKLAHEILELEKILDKLSEHLPVDIKIPNMEVFYHQLGPVFIQLFVEIEDIKEHSQLELEWLKAVRIALEEEVVVWQEKSLK
ncbi:MULTISPECIES: hypothetical protein [Halobacteriovorax]|uniref:Globin-sensor domain-containing protein n=1 Tax=Halobacteriovorax vibrionivorans TaxID=2152716 RepID=A0ABY0IGB1_9BACT|nr:MULTISPECIES: hypothetical protein [Halobacteriovorax]AYF43434.1 hypothetical protein BALOs_0422 [Halobacteriovorax sp. BALOs_7]RZF21992.1 hypothetical protein DAY19_09920 [Halobacteriovorax vibrionivorans]TGD46453.1 hypothetical protein EP118_11995 [Halobacteriovorax sp. Y22]